MRVSILGLSTGSVESRQHVSSYLINDAVAVDAGCVGFYGTPQQQSAIRHVLLTHAHADHIASLPFFLENVWTPTDDCPVVYGSSATLNTIQRCMFNDEVWPDFVAMSDRMPPFVRLQCIRPEVSFQLNGLEITPVWVNHSIPTVAYLVREGESAVIFGGDSGPTARLWQIARQTPGLRAVFLEASFPNRLTGVAEAACHLTPEMFAHEVEKLPPGVRVIAVHLKVPYRDEITRELLRLNLSSVEIGECEHQYVF